MRRACKHLVVVALVSMFVGLGVTASHPESSIAQTAPPPNPPPNIIFILTDDMRASDLQYMPNVQRLLVDQGTKFTKAWVTRSLCCPSRATTLRGQYTHNHDVWTDTDLHADMFSDTRLPRPLSFNEADVSDKPQWVRNKPRLSSTDISNMTNFYRKRLRALQSLDDVVARLVNTLSTRKDTLTGKPLIDNTYKVFTSDNGIYLGERRLTEKAAAYNAAPRVPLLIRGPGVP